MVRRGHYCGNCGDGVDFDPETDKIRCRKHSWFVFDYNVCGDWISKAKPRIVPFKIKGE